MKTKSMSRKIDESLIRLIILMVAILAIMVITKGDKLLKVSIFQTLMRQVSEVGLMAIGCGLCMISGGIDLSGVYVANLSAISAALLAQNTTANPFLSILCGLLVGFTCGLFNGFLVAYLRIPAMLATLGSYQIFQGIGIVITKGRSIQGTTFFSEMGKLKIGEVPIAFLIFLIIIMAISVIMSSTGLGKHIYFVGTNEKCSIFSGIDSKKVILKTYIISGILCSIAGLFSLARINSAKADFGTSYVMQCILIAVLGGINPNGGSGFIPGVGIAVFILQLLSSYLNVFPNISNYYRDLIWGVALISVLIANYYFDLHSSKQMAKGKRN